MPSDHLDLLDAPLVAALATRLPNGFPQTQPVWYARDGNDILVNTTLQRSKGRNMLADPRATLLIVDPADSSRWIEIRADVDLSTGDAEQQVLSVSLKGLVCTRPRDIPYGTRVLQLIWHRRRWRCKERLCPRASFTESLSAVRGRSRLTTRLRTELGYAIAEQGRVVSESAAHYGVDWSIVHAAFVARVRAAVGAATTGERPGHR